MTANVTLHRAQSYLLVGHGRLAKHLLFYAGFTGVQFEHWDRKHALSFSEFLKTSQSQTLLLAISDGAIAGFLAEHADALRNHPAGARLVHFSGALNVAGTISLHPLMAFTSELYPAERYAKIPFVVTGTKSLQDIFPKWSNPSHSLPAEDKAKYHALCVLGGNFSTLLMQKLMHGLQDLGLPQEFAAPYLQQIVQNVLAEPDRALTGPLARKDIGTLNKNLKSLAGDPYQQVYASFVHAYGITPQSSTKESNLA